MKFTWISAMFAKFISHKVIKKAFYCLHLHLENGLCYSILANIPLILHLWITFDNFADIFPICLNWIFNILYFKGTVSMLSVCCIILQIDYLEQYLRESFNTASGFYFETKSPTSGSQGFHFLLQLNEKLKTHFLSLKSINEII